MHMKITTNETLSVMIIPGYLKSTYRGSGGSSSDSAAKIQLEYELFTGNFIQCDVIEGVSNDADMVENLQKKEENQHIQ